jgi:hypothetical protein
MRCIIERPASSSQAARWWHQQSKAWGMNKHAATVFETKAAAEVERETRGLSPHTTVIVPAPQRYVTGSIEGFARRGLRRVT